MTKLALPREPYSRHDGIDGSIKALGSKVSPREIEVADLVVAGLYNREIATKLGISVKTVEVHIQHLKERSGVHNRVLLALWWAGQ